MKMADEELTLEQLKNIHKQLVQDVADLKHEETIVLSTISNPEQMRLINELQNYHKLTKHSRMLMKAQSNSEIETMDLDENKLITFYKDFSGVTVKNVSMKTIPVSEDPVDKCCYLYKVNAILEIVQFEIVYCTNKPPNNISQDNEIIKNLEIQLTENSYQLDLQEGFDFLLRQPVNISNVILYLKSADNLIIIRSNICRELLIEHKQCIDIGFADNTGQFILLCKGQKNPTTLFCITWQIKWNKVTHSAKDVFRIEIKFEDKQLLADTAPLFKTICKHGKWSSLSEKEKSKLFKNVVKTVLDADANNLTSDCTSLNQTEYSSIS